MMSLSAKDKALVQSFLRMLAATALTAYLALGKAPHALSVDDLRHIADAVIGAGALTLVNYLRPGETRFGVGSEPTP